MITGCVCKCNHYNCGTLRHAQRSNCCRLVHKTECLHREDVQVNSGSGQVSVATSEVTALEHTNDKVTAHSRNDEHSMARFTANLLHI